LFVAVEHRLALPADQVLQTGAVMDWIEGLVAAGANPSLSGSPGVPAPAELPLIRGASAELSDVLERILSSQEHTQDGTPLNL